VLRVMGAAAVDVKAGFAGYSREQER